jgi:hypothetical protein
MTTVLAGPTPQALPISLWLVRRRVLACQCTPRRKQAAKKRRCAQYGVGVAGNGEHAVLGKYAVDFDVAEGVRAPGHKRGEDPLAAFDFAEHRIGKGDFVSLTDWKELNEALRLADREVTEEQGVDQSEGDFSVA